MRQTLRLLGERALDPLLDAIRRVSLICAWAGGIVLFAAALLISFEVFIRKAFSMATGGADELSGYAFAIATAFAFGYALLERAHIRVDTGYLYLPAMWKAIFDIAAAVLLLIFFALLLRYGWEVVADTWRLNSHSSTPLHIPLIFPQFTWLLGLCLTVIVSVLLLFRALIHILLGEFDASQRLIGSRGMEEEIADELAILDEQRLEKMTRR